MIKDAEEYKKEVEALQEIVSGNHTHDVHGNEIVPPNFYQLKHAEKQREQNLERIYAIIAASGIPWEDVVAYVESDPPTQGDRVQRHRHRAANIRKHQEQVRKMREAQRGKQAKASK